jgi:PIN domain nuclease of toxin-antitoxin system
MRYLLDTSVFIWLESVSSQISPAVQQIMATAGNVFLLSLVSLWEIQIKNQLGKLPLSMPLRDVVRDQHQRNSIQLLSIEPAHIYDLSNLPDHHKDPFDRLLIAQARTEHLTFLSADSEIAKYPVTVLW